MRKRRATGSANASRRRTAREKKTNPARIVGDDEDRLGPEVGADRVAADREQEADTGEQQRHRAAERPLDEHRARDRRAHAPDGAAPSR